MAPSTALTLRELRLTPVRLTIEPTDCSRARAIQVLDELGPELLASFQTHLGVQSDRALQERYPLSQAVEVVSPGADIRTPGQFRDIGPRGLALTTKTPIATGPVQVILSRWAAPGTVEVPGRVRDSRDCGNGKHEIEIECG